MKKMIQPMMLVVLFISLMSTLPTQATIWRVNNRAGIAADFTSIQAAHNGASSGDTIFLEPSPTAYGDVILTKKLIIIGTGYFLNENPETQWKNNWPSVIGAVTFTKSPTSTSEESQLMGTTTGPILVYVSNITIKRNYITGKVSVLSYEFLETISNFKFLMNFCVAYTNLSAEVLLMDSSLMNVLVKNNFFLIYYNGGGNYPQNIVGKVIYNGTFSNNIIYGTQSYFGGNSNIILENFVVQNNIIEGFCNFAWNNNVFSYNIAYNNAFGNQNGNQQNIDMNTVFAYSGSTDGKYQLKAGSPAIGSGVGGVDCGIFGGLNPYVLSGMPPVPAIYNMMVGDGISPFNVQLNVKSHN